MSNDTCFYRKIRNITKEEEKSILESTLKDYKESLQEFSDFEYFKTNYPIEIGTNRQLEWKFFIQDAKYTIFVLEKAKSLEEVKAKLLKAYPGQTPFNIDCSLTNIFGDDVVLYNNAIYRFEKCNSPFRFERYARKVFTSKDKLIKYLSLKKNRNKIDTPFCKDLVTKIEKLFESGEYLVKL